MECIICFERFGGTSVMTAAKCGHLFHENCLKDWMQQSRTCPQCRVAIRRNGFRKIYPSVGNSSGLDLTISQAATETRLKMENEITNLKRHLETVTNENKKLRVEMENLTKELPTNRRIYTNTTVNGPIEVTSSRRIPNPLYAHVQSKVAAAWKGSH